MNPLNDGPLATVERLRDATNAHDLEGVVACVAVGLRLGSAHASGAPSFGGATKCRRNWTQIFAAIPDITTRLGRLERWTATPRGRNGRCPARAGMAPLLYARRVHLRRHERQDSLGSACFSSRSKWRPAT